MIVLLIQHTPIIFLNLSCNGTHQEIIESVSLNQYSLNLDVLLILKSPDFDFAQPMLVGRKSGKCQFCFRCCWSAIQGRSSSSASFKVVEQLE